MRSDFHLMRYQGIGLIRGSTSDVRFKNQGLDSIEVQDNGGGISPDNYGSIALKHYTSKLATFADLTTLQTFGFRGEALSSLCALSRFSIVTCMQSEAPKAKKLEFETSGKLKGTTIVAGQKGTTASVEDLFFCLPVRRRELERNIKREWGKVIGLLNQYACVQTGVKFSVWQQPNKGKRMLLFSTKGNKTTRDNLINVFGAKTLIALIPLNLRLELEATRAPGLRRDQDEDEAHEVCILGHVSRPVHGGGRQTPDRQMFYVNGRPCGLPQFAKVFNEVYRSYNSSQSPFIFADIRLDTGLYDVNVSPDKRTILLHDQAKMLDYLRDKLVQLFETQDYTVPKADLSTQRQTALRATSVSSIGRTPSLARKLVALDMSRATATPDPDVAEESAASDPSEQTHGQILSSDVAELRPGDSEDNPAQDEDRLTTAKTSTVDQDAGCAEVESEQEAANSGRSDASAPKQRSITQPNPPSNSTLSRWLSNNGRSQPAAIPPFPKVATISIGDETTTTNLVNAIKRGRLDSAGTKGRSSKRIKKDARSWALPSFGGRLSQMFAANTQKLATDSTSSAEESQGQSEGDEAADESAPEDEEPSENAEEDTELSLTNDKDVDNDSAEASSPSQSEEVIGVTEHSDEEEGGSEGAASSEGNSVQQAELLTTDDMIRLAEDQSRPSNEEGERRIQLLEKGSRRKNVTHQVLQRLRVDEQVIRAQVETWQAALQTTDPALSSPPSRAGAAEDPEAVLSLKISKSDFAKMKIIGQFNLGFVLAVRPAGAAAAAAGDDTLPSSHAEDDLFIIDQHASDEKYNFERLQTTTVVQSQRLVQPKVLELTAVEEEIVMANIPALEANGFIVKVDDTGESPVGSRIQLLSLPLSRETTFTLADLEELIFLLGDNPSASGGNGEGARGLIPRPSRTRKMFAMRACRSSIMIGRALSVAQMQKVVRHMGEMEKPWNCPHGRPTMRHLCGLGSWNDNGWQEEEHEERGGIDWAAYARG